MEVTMKMGILRTMLKRKRLQYEVKLPGKTHRGTINRSTFLKDTLAIPAEEEIHVSNRASSLVIHSNFSLMGDVIN